jgi:hypothetical protein
MTDPIQKAIDALGFYGNPDNWCLNTVEGYDYLCERRAGREAFATPENQHGAVLDEVYKAMIEAAQKGGAE